MSLTQSVQHAAHKALLGTTQVKIGVIVAYESSIIENAANHHRVSVVIPNEHGVNTTYTRVPLANYRTFLAIGHNLIGDIAIVLVFGGGQTEEGMVVIGTMRSYEDARTRADADLDRNGLNKPTGFQASASAAGTMTRGALA